MEKTRERRLGFGVLTLEDGFWPEPLSSGASLKDASVFRVRFDRPHDGVDVTPRLEGLSGNVEALLLESPEPLAFSEDVTFKLEGVGGTVEAHDVKVFSNGSETHALVFPANGALSSGDYRLTFSLDRVRFRSATPNPAARYKAEAVIDMGW